ncbi:HYC_CC_PP family protein [Niabella terrae]
MKRLLIIAILISYSIASFGVSLNYFYCCGKLKTVSFKINTEEKNCKVKTGKGCCNNKTVTVKLKTDQKSQEQTALHFNAPLSPVILHTENYMVSNIAINSNITQLCKRPPPGILPSRNILFCVFRI